MHYTLSTIINVLFLEAVVTVNGLPSAVNGNHG